jgi:hypothetical protein
MRRFLRKLTVVEWLVVIAIAVVLVVLLIPGAKWASSGDIQFPVRVFVFDASHGTPIENARVGIFYGLYPQDSKFVEENRDWYAPKDRIRDSDYGTTSAGGTVVITYKFMTGANYVRPATHAHLHGTWVHVQAEGYGGVVVPVRHDSLATATLREQKELLVPVGLMPLE